VKESRSARPEDLDPRPPLKTRIRWLALIRRSPRFSEVRPGSARVAYGAPMKSRMLATCLATLFACPVALPQGASSVYDYDWGRGQAKGQATSTTPYDWGESEVQSSYYGTGSSSSKKRARARFYGGNRTDSDKTPPSTRDEAKLTGGPGAYGGLRAGSASGLPESLDLTGRNRSSDLLDGAH
jgi:hypothetical protein